MGYTKKEETQLEESIPIYKKVLCGDNIFGNIFYPLWKDLTCVCCAYFRGMLVGSLLTSLLFWVI